MRLRALPGKALPRRIAPRTHTRSFILAAVLLVLAAPLAAGATSPRISPPPLTHPKSPPLPTLPGTATAEAVVEAGESQLRARLLVSSGSPRRVGVLFDLEPGWHLYWRNPGGTGIAPELGLEVPGHETGAIAWPAPQTFEEADGLFTTWGYEGSVLLSAPIEPTGATTPSASPIEANARVLVCRTQCVPAEFTLTSPLSPDLAASDQASIDALFVEALARVPRRADAVGVTAEAHWKSGSPAMDERGHVELVVDTCAESANACSAVGVGAMSSLFIPMEGDTFEYENATLANASTEPGRFVMSMDMNRLEEGADRLWGLVPLRDESGRLHHVEVDVPIGTAAQGAIPALAPTAAGTIDETFPQNRTEEGSGAAAASSTASPSAMRWLQIVFLALVGGLILNGMPCVLPVLAIKVFAIADMAEKDPRDVKLHGLAYTGGVLGSMALLSAIVLGLRSAGQSVGWGFQFQEPLFVASISALLVTFALNLFGTFEIDLGQGRLASVGHDAVGLRRSAFEGLLAVVLATPCTAPFLGTAVGFAFASSGFWIAAIFLAIGFGLASPFLAVSFVPNLARFIPRSGPWMNTFRSGLGFSLLATVIWLLWILGQSGGAEAVVSMTGVLLFLAFLLWGFGQLQPLRSRWLGRVGALSIAVLAFASFNLIEFDRSGDGASPAGAETLEKGWQHYSEDAVAEALAEGKPAFVVFTADWCITCKVNERTVLDRDAIRDAWSERDYALFKADWTRRDEVIRQKLAEFGRAGVPLYLVYRPDQPTEPVVLSELLTQQQVLSALDYAPDGRTI